MKPHLFDPLRFGDYAGDCLYSEDSGKAVCGKSLKDQIHALNVLYTELYDLEHDDSGVDVSEQIAEVQRKISELEDAS